LLTPASRIGRRRFRQVIWSTACCEGQPPQAGPQQSAELGEPQLRLRPARPRSAGSTGPGRGRWKPALIAAGLGDGSVRTNDLRHAHASWLLAGGADLQVVRDRLGHGSITTTEKYLHTLPEADDTALDAFSRIRDRGRGRPA
jgi:integrase